MIDELKQDAQVFTQLLTARRAVSMETLPIGTRVLWTSYLVLLEDAVKISRALLQFLERK